jgi:hypothetical protein
MNDSIVANNKWLYVKLIFIKIIEFCLFYIRNFFLVGAAMFVFLTLVVIFTFYQDKLNINPINSTVSVINDMPIIGDMIEIPQEDIHFDEKDLGNFFIRVSFYLTIFTEILRYIKIYIFKKDDKINWKLFRKRIIAVLIGISIIYSFSYIYTIVSTGGQDIIWGLIIFIIFWFMCCVASIIFLFIDLIAKNLGDIIDHISIMPPRIIK